MPWWIRSDLLRQNINCCNTASNKINENSLIWHVKLLHGSGHIYTCMGLHGMEWDTPCLQLTKQQLIFTLHRNTTRDQRPIEKHKIAKDTGCIMTKQGYSTFYSTSYSGDAISMVNLIEISWLWYHKYSFMQLAHWSNYVSNVKCSRPDRLIVSWFATNLVTRQE